MKSAIYSALILAFIFCNHCHAQQMNAPDSPCKNAVITVAASNCFAMEWKKQDMILNAFYASVLKHLDKEDGDKLRIAQRIWLQFRDANCSAEYSLYDGGTGGPPAKLACMEAVTRRRVLELHSMYDWILEK
jgi:uncharacterized protein YecT (DUF1311 family)